MVLKEVSMMEGLVDSEIIIHDDKGDLKILEKVQI